MAENEVDIGNQPNNDNDHCVKAYISLSYGTIKVCIRGSTDRVDRFFDVMAFLRSKRSRWYHSGY